MKAGNHTAPDETLFLWGQRLHHSPRGVIADVDGTLSPIAPTPNAAVVLPEARHAMRHAIATCDLVAVLSGRAAADARRMVGLPEIWYFGNHGAEWIPPWNGPPEVAVTAEIDPAVQMYLPQIQAVVTQLVNLLAARLPGAFVEMKHAGISIHYRTLPDPVEAEAVIRATLAAIPEARDLTIVSGKRVVEIRAPTGITKGTVVRDLVQRHGLRSLILCGDDVTDLDAFRAARGLREAGICDSAILGVQHAEAPAELAELADLVVPDPQALAETLLALLDRAV
jgi:trehalose 6-phosphate phosphatase